RTRLMLAASHLQSGLRHVLRDRRARADRARLSPAPLAALLRERATRLAGLSGHMDSLSPMAVLERGYVLVRNPAGVPVTRAADLRPGHRVVLTFADGEAMAKIEKPAEAAQGLLDI
ncbi:exodeoxyribonuclease VII large subunit, partial [Gluconacetobacter azotocaptans]